MRVAAIFLAWMLFSCHSYRAATLPLLVPLVPEGPLLYEAHVPSASFSMGSKGSSLCCAQQIHTPLVQNL